MCSRRWSRQAASSAPLVPSASRSRASAAPWLASRRNSASASSIATPARLSSLTRGAASTTRSRRSSPASPRLRARPLASARVHGRLRVNLDPYFARLVLAPRLGRFLADYPELALELVVRDRVGDLVGEGFDAAIRFGEPSSPSAIRRRLLQSRVLTCASPRYLARHGRPSRPQDLSHGHTCLLFRDPATGRPFGWEFRRGRERVDVPVSGRLVVNDLALLLEVCAAGEGVAQVLDLGIAPLLANGTLINLFPRWTDERFPLYVFHPSRHLPPARLRAFLDFVAAFTPAISAR